MAVRRTKRGWAATPFISAIPISTWRDDLDTFLLAVASQYLGTCQREIKKAFPHTLFMGPDSIGSWGAPARVPGVASGQQIRGCTLWSGPLRY